MTELASELYLISPLDVTGLFPDRLARALDAGPVAAFQFRVKGLDDHAAAKLAERMLADTVPRHGQVTPGRGRPGGSKTQLHAQRHVDVVD